MIIWALIFIIVNLLWGICFAFKLPFCQKERFFLGLSLGFICSSLLIFCLSLLFKNIFKASLIITAAQALTIPLLMRFSKFNISLLQLKQFFKKELVFLSLLVIFTVLFLNLLLFQSLSFKGENYSVGGSNFGDLPLHLSYITSFSYGNNFPPENPLFAGTKLVYQFLPDFLSSILIVLGFSLRWSLIFPSLIFFITLFTSVYYLAKDRFGRLAALFATPIFFMGWNLGYLFFFREVIRDKNVFLSELININRHYTWDYNIRLYSPMANLFVPERAFMPGLILGILFLRLLWLALQKKKKTIKEALFLGMLLAILPFWHFHTFLAVIVFSFIWFFVYLNNNFKKLKEYLFFWFLLGLASFFVLLPQYFWAAQQTDFLNFFHYHFCWTKENESVFLYWFKNGSFVLLFLPITFYLARKQWAFFLPAIFLFLIANFVSFQPWEWDNIKIFVFCFLFFSLLLGDFLAILVRKPKLYILVILIFLLTVLYFPIAYRFETRVSLPLYSVADFEFADWLVASTPARAIFLVSTRHNHPVSSLAGRKTFLGYPGFLWVHNIDYHEREIILKKAFKGDIDLLKKSDLQINYIVFNSQDKLKYPKGYSFFKDNYAQAYKDQHYTMFLIK